MAAALQRRLRRLRSEAPEAQLLASLVWRPRLRLRVRTNEADRGTRAHKPRVRGRVRRCRSDDRARAAASAPGRAELPRSRRRRGAREVRTLAQWAAGIAVRANGRGGRAA